MKVLIKPTSIIGSTIIPGSKSITHRAIICAAFSKDVVTIENANICDDTKITMALLKNIGVNFEIFENTIKVIPPKSFTAPKKVVNAHNSGTSIRFMGPIYWQLFHKFEVMVDNRMYERLIETQDGTNTSIKIITKSTEHVHISIEFLSFQSLINTSKTSQYTSGTILSTIIDQGASLCFNETVLKNPYVKMTIQVMKDFAFSIEIATNFMINVHQNKSIKTYCVESDYSLAANFLVMGMLNGDVSCASFHKNSCQGDSKIVEYLKKLNGDIKYDNGIITSKSSTPIPGNFKLGDTPDLVPLIAALLAITPGKSKIENIQRLKYKETNRINETIKILTTLGGNISLNGDSLLISGQEMLDNPNYLLLPNDHRLVMMVIAISSHFKNPIILDNVEAINKSYPNFINTYLELGGNCENIDS